MVLGAFVLSADSIDTAWTRRPGFSLRGAEIQPDDWLTTLRGLEPGTGHPVHRFDSTAVAAPGRWCERGATPPPTRLSGLFRDRSNWPCLAACPGRSLSLLWRDGLSRTTSIDHESRPGARVLVAGPALLWYYFMDIFESKMCVNNCNNVDYRGHI